jgi:hypothetical protein
MAANAQRSLEAGPEQARLARLVLDSGVKLTPAPRRALELRAANPLGSWSDLAAEAGGGATRYSLASGYRQALVSAGLKEPAHRSLLPRHMEVIATARSNPAVTRSELAELTGLAYATVGWVLREAGLRLPSGDPRKEAAAQRRAAREAAAQARREAAAQARRDLNERIIAAARADGAYLELVADQCGVPVSSAAKVIAKAGIALADGRATPRGLHPCGTPAAAARHNSHGEELDHACREAKRAYDRAHNGRRQRKPAEGLQP